MNKIVLILFVCIIVAQEECTDGRYFDEIFNITVEEEVFYGQNINETFFGGTFTESLYMDIYSPENDNFEDRPLIFFMFGGSFIGGSKDSWDIVTLCENYAKMGYVAVAIDYRLSLNSLFVNPNEENAYKAVLKAIHDVKAAIRYFRMNDELENEYRIDSNRIYVGGVSAGAIAAINAAYLDDINEVPSFLIDDFNELGGFEGLSGNEGYDSSFHGIVNLCGAAGDADWIEEGDIPIVSMHGDLDDIVPYDDSLVTLFGLNIQVDGSYIIHQTMLELGNQSDLYTYFDQGHTPFSNNMDLETEFTKSFLYDFVCASEELSGDINFDGILNILDVVQLINFILGEIPTDELFNISDMNGDEQLNVQDIILLINIILS